ncbi:hypothetical protein [Amycolatopsis sp. NPDC051903]|uniref:hypothetical protein n=1 Tax=Amycolatopsis sp. NPDC051903 TaxID=3363936 RepID=UPI0037B55541
MDQNEPRRRRRAGNQAARSVFEEARRAGLVRRHLLKLRYLADHPQHGENPRRIAEPPAPDATPRRRRRKENAVQLLFDFAQPEPQEGKPESDRTTTGQSTSDAA